MVAPPESIVGKFRMYIKESSEPSRKPQDSIEAIANWLLKQWQNNNAVETRN